MLNKASTLTGYTLDCQDGEIGKVKDFFFDDLHWTIRYLVADTGNWFTGRQVLLSPHALVAVKNDNSRILLSLSKKQLEDSPSLDSDKPVSRQFEQAYYGYFGWPLYWSGANMWGAESYPNMISAPKLGRESDQPDDTPAGNIQPSRVKPPEELLGAALDTKNDPHLRSTHAVRGHDIHASDGDIGHVADFLMDDKTWAIRYLVIDTVNWWPGKKVLVSPRWITRISWFEQKVFVNLSRALIKQAPEYTEETVVTRAYEAALHRHYSQPGYWQDETEGRPA